MIRLTLCVAHFVLGASAQIITPVPGLPAPEPRVEYFGVTCGPPSPTGSPRIRVLGLPHLGGPLAFVMDDLFSHKLYPQCDVWGRATLAIGFSDSNWGGLQLPHLLPGFLTRNYSCFISTSTNWLLSAGVIAGVGSSEGALLGGIHVPTDPALLGTKFYAQWIAHMVQWGPACPDRFEWFFTSNAAALTIGR